MKDTDMQVFRYWPHCRGVIVDFMLSVTYGIYRLARRPRA